MAGPFCLQAIAAWYNSVDSENFFGRPLTTDVASVYLVWSDWLFYLRLFFAEIVLCAEITRGSKDKVRRYDVNTF